MDLGGKLGIVSLASGDVKALAVSGTNFAWGTPGIAYLVGLVSRVRNLGKPRNTVWLIDPKTRHRRVFGSPPVGYTIGAIAWSAQDKLAAVRDAQGIPLSRKGDHLLPHRAPHLTVQHAPAAPGVRTDLVTRRQTPSTHRVPGPSAAVHGRPRWEALAPPQRRPRDHLLHRQPALTLA